MATLVGYLVETGSANHTIDPDTLCGGWNVTAIATGYIRKGYVYFGNTEETAHFKMCVYRASDNIRIAMSSVKTGVSQVGWETFTFDGTVQITSGNAYHIQVISDEYWEFYRLSDGQPLQSGSYLSDYDSPATTYVLGNEIWEKSLMYLTDENGGVTPVSLSVTETLRVSELL